MKDKLILVAGGGGFIGGHLVAHFRNQGYKHIRSVDVKPLDEWYQVFDDVENVEADLKLREACQSACKGVSESLQPRRRHGRHGLHRKQQSPLHALGADQHPHARSRSTPKSIASFTRSVLAFTTPISNATKTSCRSRRRLITTTPAGPSAATLSCPAPRSCARWPNWPCGICPSRSRCGAWPGPGPRPGSCSRARAAASGWFPALRARRPPPVPTWCCATSVVDWCRRFADRINPDDLTISVDGDADLARDLVAAANSFAGL